MYFIFDIGGTKARFATSSDGKNLSEPRIVPTPKDFQEGLQTIKQIADELSKGQKIEVISGGVAGPLSQDKSMLVSSPHIGGWINKPLKTELEKLFNAPVHLEHDADLATLGEAVVGAGKGREIVTYLTISTGVGGGRVVKGKIDENALGFEPGHQIIVPFGDPCNCGGQGHLESYVSGSGLERKYGKKAEDLDDPYVWEKVAEYLAMGLNNVTVFWSPDIIVLGGSVMQSIQIETLRVKFKDILTIFPTPPVITLSNLGDSAGLYGALALHPFS
ncbi:MAG: ROK family protein [Patescibacteria group bacterium]